MKLTVQQAAELLSVSEDTVYEWIRKGDIPFRRVHEQYRIHQADLLEWAVGKKLHVSPALLQTVNRADDEAATLSEAFVRGGVHHRVPGRDRDAVLRAIVGRLPDIPEDERSVVFDMLLAREALGSTAVGDGIAIPHVRHPVLSAVDAPSLALCFLDEPVDFRAPDGKPVFAIFMLISPTNRIHLLLLSRISAALHDSEFKRLVQRRASSDEIFARACILDAALAQVRSPDFQ